MGARSSCWQLGSDKYEDKAKDCAEKSVLYYLDLTGEKKSVRIANLADRMNSPLIGHGVTAVKINAETVKKRLTEKLMSPELASLRGSKRLAELIEKVNSL